VVADEAAVRDNWSPKDIQGAAKLVSDAENQLEEGRTTLAINQLRVKSECNNNRSGFLERLVLVRGARAICNTTRRSPLRLESFFARTACWLQRDVGCDCDSRMLSVEHVIPVIDIVHIDIVGSVPNGRPGFWARINHSKPEASELETWGTFDHHDWYVVHAKPVSPAKMSAEAIVRNAFCAEDATRALRTGGPRSEGRITVVTAVSVIAAAFVPGAVLSLPIVRTLALPEVLPHISDQWHKRQLMCPST
jgi:hypothetical protein